MKKRISALFFIIVTACFSGDLPIDKEELMSKYDNIVGLGMGKADIAFFNKNGVISNPASASGEQDSQMITTYSLSAYKSEFDNTVIQDNRLTGVFFVSEKGAVYYRDLYPTDERGTDKNRYSFGLKEFGVVFAEKSKTDNGLSVGLGVKGYLSDILDAEISGASLKRITIDKGYGAGVDFGFIYTSGMMSVGFSWKDVITKVFYSKYNQLSMDGRLSAGIGIDSGFFKYGFAANKLLNDTYGYEFSHGVEWLVLAIPEKYSFFFLKGLKAKVRAGKYGDDILAENGKYTYGLGVETVDSKFDAALVSVNQNPFVNQDETVFKASITMNIN